jgi:NTE family protein
MDVATTRSHVLRDGPLLPALLASSAIPGIYPAVEHDGLLLYDGGVVANVPMRQALALGARSLVVLDCTVPGAPLPPPESFADAVLLSAMVTMRSQAMLEAPLAAAEAPVVYLPGPPLHRVSPLDFTHTASLIEQAYDAARPFLEDLTLDGPGIYGSPSGI